MTLIDLQDHINYFCLKISVAYFFVSYRKSIGDLTTDDIAIVWLTLKVILRYYRPKRFHYNHHHHHQFIGSKIDDDDDDDDDNDDDDDDDDDDYNETV